MTFSAGARPASTETPFVESQISVPRSRAEELLARADA
jgi:hypothetical protein